jgi:urease accessory protein
MNPWLFLQLADSAFPTGGFAHSAGLEAAAQLGEVRGADDLEIFVRATLWQAGRFALPFARATFHEPVRIQEEVDRLCRASLASHVARGASRTQGRAFLATTARVFAIPSVTELEDAVRAKRLDGHYAPLFGAILSALDASWEEASRLHLFQTLRQVLSAAVRLNLVGTHDAARLQHALATTAEEVHGACKDTPLESYAQTSPRFELCASVHDRLYARLFQS